MPDVKHIIHDVSLVSAIQSRMAAVLVFGEQTKHLIGTTIRPCSYGQAIRKYLWRPSNSFKGIYMHSRLKSAIKYVMQAPVGMRFADSAIYGLPYSGTKWGW